MNYDKLIIDFIESLLRSKYDKYIFYCHNLGGYDVIFIIKALIKYNEINNYYNIKSIFRNSRILELKISKKYDKSQNRVIIINSYAMLNSLLELLGENFDVDTKKSIFPHEFTKRNTLFYKGDTPYIKFYYNLNYIEYYKIKVDNWSFKDQALKYISIDINSLYEVLIKAAANFFMKYDIKMLDYKTISGLSYGLFLRDYFDKNISLINTLSIYQDIKQTYYRGIIEVYISSDKYLYYYYINSLYPYIALQPMPGIECTKENFLIHESYLDFIIEIITPNDLYIGLLPHRTNDSSLLFPLRKWRGWYFSKKLKFAQNHGYKIKVLNCYTFSKSYNIFTKYINTIYQHKVNTTNIVEKYISKSLFNKLLGKFGIKLDKSITEIVSTKRFSIMRLINKISGYQIL